jgi:hypothetical protein
MYDAYACRIKKQKNMIMVMSESMSLLMKAARKGSTRICVYACVCMPLSVCKYVSYIYIYIYIYVCMYVCINV